jgi:Glyoxalase-like domain
VEPALDYNGRRWLEDAVLSILLVPSLLMSALNSQAAQPMTVDHVSVCGSDLPRMQRAFAEAGLVTDYGGPHANSYTQMALLGFEDGSYIELIAPREGAKVPNQGQWAAKISGNAGPCAWAINSRHLAADLERLKQRGIRVDASAYGNRKKPDGTLIEWDTAAVGSGEAGSMLPFIIQDRTPRSLRVQPSKSVAGTGLIGIAWVLIAVQDLDKSAALFRKAYDWPAPQVEVHPELGAKLSYFPHTPVVLATPSDPKSWVARRLADVGEGPAAYIIRTRDFAATQQRFSLGTPAKWFGHNVAWFDSDELNGARLTIVGQ